MKTWKPDTCSCKVEEIYETIPNPNAGQIRNITIYDDVYEAGKNYEDDIFVGTTARIVEFVEPPLLETGSILGGGKVLRKCQAHASVPDADLYDVLLNRENRLKNQVLRVLLGYESVKGLGLEESKTNPDGSSAGLGLKAGIEYVWSFVGTGVNRVFQFQVKGANLNIAQKGAIQTFCDTAFGMSKVEIL